MAKDVIFLKAIVGGKIILKDRIVENCALLYTDKIEGVIEFNVTVYQFAHFLYARKIPLLLIIPV